MARAIFVKAAAKDYPHAGIKKGESYYWWKFRFGGKRFSKTPPRRSQLTQSDFLGQIYDMEDAIGEMECSDVDDFNSQRDDFVSQLQDLASEQADKLSNMPDSLQQGPTGEMLQNREESCNSWAEEIEGVSVDEPTEVEDPADDEPVRGNFESDEAFEAAQAEHSEKLEAFEAYEQELSEAISNAIEELRGTSYQGE